MDFDLQVLYFYGGLIPYVGRYVFFPTFVVTFLLSGPHLYIMDLLQWPLTPP